MKSLAAELATIPVRKGEGIACPACGGASMVIDSRQSHLTDGADTVRRRRACKNNRQHKFTTYELVVKVETDGRGSKEQLLRRMVHEGVAAELRRLLEKYELPSEVNGE